LKPTSFFLSKQYETALEKIEDFLLAQTGSLVQVERFLAEHDQALEFIGENPAAAAIHPATGDQSWIFADGRYRIFFYSAETGTFLHFYMTDIIDNRQANQHVYPGNSIPTYEED